MHAGQQRAHSRTFEGCLGVPESAESRPPEKTRQRKIHRGAHFASDSCGRLRTFRTRCWTISSTSKPFVSGRIPRDNAPHNRLSVIDEPLFRALVVLHGAGFDEVSVAGRKIAAVPIGSKPAPKGVGILPPGAEHEFARSGYAGFPDDVAQIALAEIEDWADDRETWLRVGMAHDWSQSGRGYNRRENRAQWNGFKESRDKLYTMRSVMSVAHERHRNRTIVDEFTDDDEDEDDDLPLASDDEIKEESEKLGIPEHLLRFPKGSILEHVAEYYNATALVEQRQFAIQAGIIFASTVCGRNHRTNYGKPNYGTIYTINVGDTGAGKESIKDAVELLLEASGLDHLVGPRDYTSESAVMSKLIEKPKHVAFIDELGKRLKDDRKGGGNGQKDSAYTAFLELFSKCHGTYRGTAMSTNNKTKEEVEAIQKRKVVRPALTLAGLTTPDTFYGAVSAADVSSGFLNRFLIVQSQSEPFQEQRIDIPEVDPPAKVLRWAKRIAFETGDDDDIAHHVDTTLDVEPVVTPFSKKAYEYLRIMERERVGLQREFAEYGLADLFSRTREIAMRLSLVIAISCDSDTIKLDHLKWSWEYVSFYQRQTAEAFRANAGKSELHKLADEAATYIKSKGEEGISESKLYNNKREIGKLIDRDKEQFKSFLRDLHQIVAHKVGRNGYRFIHPKFVKRRERD
ncbi:PriCT-2 domain-containing protein [Pelagibacterium sp.]|uniref:PriCT-2 domain-containing protein n=1 Tax=Pelagibacterium sp. TaxID=1967288 RepID=UPI003BA87B9D